MDGLRGEGLLVDSFGSSSRGTGSSGGLSGGNGIGSKGGLSGLFAVSLATSIQT